MEWCSILRRRGGEDVLDEEVEEEEEAERECEDMVEDCSSVGVSDSGVSGSGRWKEGEVGDLVGKWGGVAMASEIDGGDEVCTSSTPGQWCWCQWKSIMTKAS